MTDTHTQIDRNTWEALALALDKVQEAAETIVKTFELDPATTKLRTAACRRVFILHNIQGYDIVVFLDGSAVMYHPGKALCYILQHGKFTRLYVEQGNNMSYTANSVERAIAGAETLEEFFMILELQ